MNENQGIYVMKSKTDDVVKIGWSKDIEGRRLGFNRSPLCKSPYEVYYIYMTDGKRRDIKVHNLIDLINKRLRLTSKKEFYKITPEAAGQILKLVSEITGTEKCYKDKRKYLKRRRQNRTFKELNVPIGSTLVLAKDSNKKCEVLDAKNKVLYKKKPYTISKLANKLLGGYNNGFEKFKYKGTFLVDLKKS
ncbi:MAG: GIY-YIG nuclease family protein [Lachnospiraceae bacterium]|nr:GIY-YIG nuclease family protein [Lachnospiraceae bacterium]